MHAIKVLALLVVIVIAVAVIGFGLLFGMVILGVTDIEAGKDRDGRDWDW